MTTISRLEQSRLSKRTVCVIGLGGLGGAVTEMLARIGIGSLILVDGDRFEVSNLNRQLLSTEDEMGRLKAEVAGERIRQINSEIKGVQYPVFLTPENTGKILKGCDLVVDCLDTIKDRFILQDAARNVGIPLVSGAIAGTSGQVITIFPEDAGFERVYGNRKSGVERKGVEDILGNLSFCAMFIASMQASETVKVLLGRGELLRNRLFIADLMSNTYEVIDLVG